MSDYYYTKIYIPECFMINHARNPCFQAWGGMRVPPFLLCMI